MYRVKNAIATTHIIMNPLNHFLCPVQVKSNKPTDSGIIYPGSEVVSVQLQPFDRGISVWQWPQTQFTS